MKSIIASTALLLSLAQSSLAQDYYDDSSSTMASMASTTASSSSGVQTVMVGGGGLIFSPDSVTANTGDVIEFVFGSGHSVAQSSFSNPCQPINDQAIFSGFPTDGDIFSVTVNDTKPIWIYCSTPGHCQGGMVMAINAPSSGNTLDAYKQASSSASGSSSPQALGGGVFGAAQLSGSSSSSSSGSSGSSSSTSSSPSSSSSGNGAAGVAANLFLGAGLLTGALAMILS